MIHVKPPLTYCERNTSIGTLLYVDKNSHFDKKTKYHSLFFRPNYSKLENFTILLPSDYAEKILALPTFCCRYIYTYYDYLVYTSSSNPIWYHAFGIELTPLSNPYHPNTTYYTQY